MPDKSAWREMLATGNDMREKMALVAFSMDALRDPEDALVKWARSPDSFEKWEKKHFNSLVQEVAQRTGADPAQIANPATRTPEQQRAILEVAAREQVARMDAFFESNYYKGLTTLNRLESKYDEPEREDEYSHKEVILLYFFTTHPEINPGEPATMTDEDTGNLTALYRRYEAFLDSYFTKNEHTEREYWIALEAFAAQENPVDAQEILDHLQGVVPTKYIMPNNKMANTITKGIVDVGKVTLEVNRRGAKKLIETTCILSYEGDNVKLTGRQAFTQYDRSVYDAVSTLYVAGDPAHVITPAQVYRTMTGTDSTPSPQQLAAVTRSLDKMRFIRARINCTDELRARRITLNSQQINHGEIDTYLLTAEAVRVEAGGNKITAYKVIKTPILYEYASAIGQVLTLPAAVIDVKKLNRDGSISTRSMPSTEDRIVVKSYLIRRIEGMKGKNGLHKNTIPLYDYERDGETHEGLYSIAGRADADRKEQQRLRDDVEAMLAYWAAAGFIKGFKVLTKSRKITGYEIDP